LKTYACLVFFVVTNLEKSFELFDHDHFLPPKTLFKYQIPGNYNSSGRKMQGKVTSAYWQSLR